jgi:hypothetical protein
VTPAIAHKLVDLARLIATAAEPTPADPGPFPWLRDWLHDSYKRFCFEQAIEVAREATREMEEEAMRQIRSRP